MAKTITISGTSYSLPSQNDPGPWGEDLSDLIEAMSTVLNTLNGTGDILTTNFTIADAQGTHPSSTGAANVTGLSFDVGTVRSAIVSYSIYRSTDSAELGEVGFMLLTYMTDADAWTMTRYANDDAGVAFFISDAGQVTYTSTDMAGASYSGLMKFKASAFTQA